MTKNKQEKLPELAHLKKNGLVYLFYISDMGKLHLTKYCYARSLCFQM